MSSFQCITLWMESFNKWVLCFQYITLSNFMFLFCLNLLTRDRRENFSRYISACLSFLRFAWSLWNHNRHALCHVMEHLYNIFPFYHWCLAVNTLSHYWNRSSESWTLFCLENIFTLGKSLFNMVYCYFWSHRIHRRIKNRTKLVLFYVFYL